MDNYRWNSKYPKIFPVFFINMTRIGELSGTLDVIMMRLAEYYDKDTKAILFMNHVKTPSYKFENEFIEHEENSFLITYDDIKNDFKNVIKNGWKEKLRLLFYIRCVKCLIIIQNSCI